jgi:histidine triad (HIT) family protein
MSDSCLFCRIAAGDIPAEIVYSTDSVVAFRDLNPQAPTHVLVIPRDHHTNVGELGASDPTLAGDLLAAAAVVAEREGLGQGWRLVFNTGPAAGQTVFHVHGHVLGGRSLTWPPG